MDFIERIVGVVLIVIGLVIAIHTIIEPLYHVSTDASPYSPGWNILDPVMALAVVLGVIFGCLRKRAVDRDGNGAPITRAYLAANTQLYGFLFIGILFFWNWFNLLSPDFTAVGADAIDLVWAFINAALPLLSVTLGLHLVRTGTQQ